MKITFEQSGGFAGLRFSTAIDTDVLTPEKAQDLIRLVEAADFFNLPARIVSIRPQPDRFQYKLTVREKGRQHTVAVSEEAMPVSLGPLVKWLAEAARQGREKGGKA
ncbi:MAG TPA: protealysin inhibitor emfourin [Geobacteraceae bacterium]